MTRYLSIVALSILCAATLTACGGDDGSAPYSADKDPSSPCYVPPDFVGPVVNPECKALEEAAHGASAPNVSTMPTACAAGNLCK